MAQFRNTFFTEHAPDSPNERWGPGASGFTRTFDLSDGSYQGRVQAAYDFLGYSVVANSGITQEPYYISRVIPLAYPGLAAATFLLPPDLPAIGTIPNPTITPPDIRNRFYAVGISRTEPLGAPQGIDKTATPLGGIAPDYLRSRLTVEFSSLPYQIKDDSFYADVNGVPNEGAPLAVTNLGWSGTRYITRQIKGFSRLIKIPYGLVQVEGKQTKVAVPYREGGCSAEYTWMKVPLDGPVPGIDFEWIAESMNTVNSQLFDFFDARTLLFDNYETREYQGTFGEHLADVTFRFIQLSHPSTGYSGLYEQGTPTGWDTVIDVVNKNIDYYPATDLNGHPLWAGTNFANLFCPLRPPGAQQKS